MMPVVNSSTLRPIPYPSESTKKETLSKEPAKNNADRLFQRASLRGYDVSSPDEGAGLSAGDGSDRLFAFIREEHLQEAREFRLKGYNSQIPEVDAGLLLQLRDVLATAKSRLCLQATVEGPLGSRWLLDQMAKIERLAGKLSDDVMKSWVKHELSGKSREETAETELSSRRSAQSLVRRLESILQTLIYIVHNICTIDDNSTPEKRHDMLVDELTDAVSSGDKNRVIQALRRMTTESTGEAAWTSLMEARAAAWEAGKPATVSAMIETSRHEAEKASKKARDQQGASQAFFSHVAAYLQSLSCDLAKSSINASQGASSLDIPLVNNDKAAVTLSRSNSFRQDIDKKKLQVQIALAGVKVHAHRLLRVTQCGHPTATPTKTPERVIADSIIRSILWQWQQPAIKIQYISAALLSKVRELKKIEGILASCAVADERRSEEKRRNITVSHTGVNDMDAQVREWVSDSIEQITPEKQLATKAATLERLLSGDIASARNLVKRLGITEESIQNMLRRQRYAVLKMIVERLPAVTSSLQAVDTLLPEMAGNLTASIAALNKALHAAEYLTRDFTVAKKQADSAQLLATKVKESLSAESAQLTGRPLNEHSRGSRLAKHWANLAKEHNQDNYPPPDAERVFMSLKEKGLREGILSTGDPCGYLFATRLAGELENAGNDELILPMSPEQYAALEKGLVEYIVKWGQKRNSREVARIVIELSFEQTLDTVSFNLSRLFRLPYKILKASIKIPYQLNKVNDFIMPGQDKPYKAIYGLLGKKLQQLGFNLLTAPVPGVIKFAVGAGVTAGAVLHNRQVGDREKTFSAVYQRMVEGKKSQKIKMNSVQEGVFDSVLDAATTAVFKGAQRVWISGKSENKVIPHKAQLREMITENNNSAWGDAAPNKREVLPVSHLSPLQQPADVKPFSDEYESDSAQPRSRSKRSVANITSPPSSLGDDHIRHLGDFDHNIYYGNLSSAQKKQTYLHGIQFVLLQIENDEHFPKEIRHNAYLARINARKLVPVDIYGYKLNNAILLPDSPGAKSGVLIRLSAELPYYYVKEGKDLLESVKYAMPYNANEWKENIIRFDRGSYPGSANDLLRNIRLGNLSYDKYFNYNNPAPMDIASISAYLADTIEADYKLKGWGISNKRLMSRAFAGAQIPDPGVSATEVKYQLEFTWDKLTPAEYLRSFSRPFSTLSGQMQLISSSMQGETVQETELHVHQAEYIGSWVDATVGTAISFTPAGVVFNVAQSVADITADLTEDKDPDPMAVAGLVVGCIPGSRIAAKVGKFTRIGGETIKYGLMLGNKSIDLAMVGKSIKTAVDTGEPLAIYQAFLASGMSVKNSYDMAKNISSKLKISIRMEDRASLELLENIKDSTVYHASVRTFMFGNIMLQGKIINSEVYISSDDGLTWKKGSHLHLLACRLQNSGGKLGTLAFHRNEIVIGGHKFQRVKYSQDKLNKMMGIAKTYKTNSNPTARMARLQQDYKTGKEMSHAPQYDHYNSLSLDEKLNLFNEESTNAITRGVLAGKINEYITRINLYNHASAADDWKMSANKATEVVLVPQNIFLKGRTGRCLPESVLMGRALESGRDKTLVRKLMDVYSSGNIDDNPLYKSLVELHSNANASKFNKAVIPEVKLSTLSDVEKILFTPENSSVRVDTHDHTMLISKVNKEGGMKYSFYDPNYGLAYFGKYEDMIVFFKEKIQEYDAKEITAWRLDYSRLTEIKIAGRNLDDIINDETPGTSTNTNR